MRLAPCVFTAAFASFAGSQAPANLELAPRQVSLADLNGFRATSANWKIAGGATADRARPLAMTALSGAGVLVNTPTKSATGQLFTTWEHGDLELSLDVMMPKGSNSGIYLMGRYEVQLFDSWGVHSPTFADLGGIYQRWDDKRGKGQEGFEGVAPRQNVSRAPGLWQHIDILFRAPKFAGPQKIANARFVKVAVNGVVVQENVEVSGPTRAAAFDDERATGPLMIQGDHGPVAVRTIRYKAYAGAAKLTGLRYHVFEGERMDSSFVATNAPVREGDATGISGEAAGVGDKFAIFYDGSLTLPTSGLYRLQLNLGWIGNDSLTRGAAIGGGKLVIDGKPVVVHTGAERRAYADVELKSGAHTFALTFFKNRTGFNRRDVTVWIEGPGVERQALHDDNGGGFNQQPTNPIVVDATTEPVILRSFIRHLTTKRVIAVSVADPAGVHFSYDLAQGALLHVWRGPFLETTQMWHERGEDQLAEPMGSVITLAGVPSLAFLGDAKAAWPDSVDAKQLRRDGYALDKGGHPTFLSHVGGVAVEDDIRPDADGLTLRRELRLHASTSVDGLYLQLAQGDHISRQADGSYVVGDRSFYITVPKGHAAPVIRTLAGHDELVLPVKFDRGDATVGYSIVW